MKMRLKYAPLAIATVIVSAIAFLGTYMIYSSLNDLVYNGNYSYLTFSSQEATTNTMIVFFLGIVATAVVAIIQIVFFIYEERKLMIIGSGILAMIEFILFLRFFDALISSFMSGINSLFLGSSLSQTEIISSIMGSLQLTLIFTLLGLIVNVIIILQMYHVIHLSFLQPYMPELVFLKVQKQDENPSQNEGGEQL